MGLWMNGQSLMKHQCSKKKNFIATEIGEILQMQITCMQKEFHNVLPSPFLLVGVEPRTKFLKRGEGLDRTSTFRVGLMGKRVVTSFSVITKNSNWDILSKNLVTFKR